MLYIKVNFMNHSTYDDVFDEMMRSFHSIIDTTSSHIFEDDVSSQKEVFRKYVGWFDDVLFEYDY